jgi:hypothetical protein
MPPGPSNIRGALGRLASRRRRSETSSRALPHVSSRSRGAAYKATEARRKRIFADHLYVARRDRDRYSIDAPVFQAHLAQWLRTQLMLCAPPPYRRAIKMMPTTLSLRHCCSSHSVLAIDRVPFGVHTNGSALSSLPVSRNRLGWACAIVCVSALIKFAYTWPAGALNQHGLGVPLDAFAGPASGLSVSEWPRVLAGRSRPPP